VREFGKEGIKKAGKRSGERSRRPVVAMNTKKGDKMGTGKIRTRYKVKKKRERKSAGDKTLGDRK